ncbi:MAG: hypothetical protein BWY81_01387 [Firmicutes bacterium ADurb.Bin467]|nr:MAG: hypothetical protein BWY81_01387 [Firmicutes bacterium ADurb.Bin467]
MSASDCCRATAHDSPPVRHGRRIFAADGVRFRLLPPDGTRFSARPPWAENLRCGRCPLPIAAARRLTILRPSAMGGESSLRTVSASDCCRPMERDSPPVRHGRRIFAADGVRFRLLPRDGSRFSARPPWAENLRCGRCPLPIAVARWNAILRPSAMGGESSPEGIRGGLFPRSKDLRRWTQVLAVRANISPSQSFYTPRRSRSRCTRASSGPSRSSCGCWPC